MSRFMFNAGTVVGGNDAFTQILLHFDGTSGSTSIIDSNPNNARSWITTASAPLSASVAKFGPTSLYGGLVNSPNGPYTNSLAGIVWGTNNFTIDFWIYPLSPTNGYAITWQGDEATAGGSSIQVLLNPTNAIGFTVSDGTTFARVNFQSAQVLPYNTWSHVACVRSGLNYYIFINGILQGSQALGDLITVPTPGFAYRVSTRSVDSDYGANCFIDEFRLSIGVARWTGNFTPNSQPYG